MFLTSLIFKKFFFKDMFFRMRGQTETEMTSTPKLEHDQHIIDKIL